MALELERLVGEAGLARLGPFVAAARRPAIGIALGTRETTPAVGASKLGGWPDLPPEVAWPAADGRPLTFVVQIDLACTRPLDAGGALPGEGLLSLFVDLAAPPRGFHPADRARWRLLFLPYRATLAPRRSGQAAVLPERALTFYPLQTLPRFGSRAAEDLWDAGGLGHADWESFLELARRYEARFRPPGAANQHLLGHAANRQGDMQLEAALASAGVDLGTPRGRQDPRARALAAGAGAWRLLLQLDSDPAAGLVWPGQGTLYLWIRAADLAAGEFRHAWAIRQST